MRCPLCSKQVRNLREHLKLTPDPNGDTAMRSMSHPTEYARVWPCPWCPAIYFHDDPLSDHLHYDCPNRPPDEGFSGEFCPTCGR